MPTRRPDSDEQLPAAAPTPTCNTEPGALLAAMSRWTKRDLQGVGRRCHPERMDPTRPDPELLRLTVRAEIEEQKRREKEERRRRFDRWLQAATLAVKLVALAVAVVSLLRR